MGNHFRTPGDEQAMPQVPQVDPVVPVPPAPSADVQDRLFEQPVVQGNPQTMFDAPVVGAPQPAAVPAVEAQPVDAPAPQAANPLFNVPSPDMPAAPMNIPSPMDAPAPAITPDQAAEVASLDAALANNLDFTTVFAPVDDSRARQAREAGVEPVILMEHVTKIYPAQPNKPALDDVNIEIYPGEFVFLVGHSGSGKTTLLNTMLRNVKPTSGRIMVAGQDLMKIKNRKIPFLRRQIGAVFQDYKLLPNRTAYENVAFALQCIGKPKAVI